MSIAAGPSGSGNTKAIHNFPYTLIITRHARDVCSFLGPEAWQPLRSASVEFAEAMQENILHGALIDALAQKAASLTAAPVLAEEQFREVEDALRLATADWSGKQCVQDELEKILECVRCSVGCLETKVTTTDGREKIRVQARGRTLLRGTDPGLWLAATRAFPCLYLGFCNILMRWPCTYLDRDALLEAGAASVAALGAARLKEPVVAAAGLMLGVRLSCVSEHRVALLEREGLSTAAAEALQAHVGDDQVTTAALAYLNNMANCEEQWPTLLKLDAGPACREAMRRRCDAAHIQDHARHVLEVIEYHA